MARYATLRDVDVERHLDTPEAEVRRIDRAVYESTLVVTPAALPLAECLSGFKLALDNAARLHRTAQLLVGSDPHSAALLAVYAADEMGKASLIAYAGLRRDKSETTWREFRHEFKHHPSKLRMITRLAVLFGGGYILPDDYIEKFVRRLAGETFEHRNAVAYVDLVNDRFVTPMAAVSASECAQTVRQVGEVLERMMHARPRVIDMFREEMRGTTDS